MAFTQVSYVLQPSLWNTGPSLQFSVFCLPPGYVHGFEFSVWRPLPGHCWLVTCSDFHVSFSHAMFQSFCKPWGREGFSAGHLLFRFCWSMSYPQVFSPIVSEIFTVLISVAKSGLYGRSSGSFPHLIWACVMGLRAF